uniref:Translocated promoter region a, nuclear basket protein n=1 Tax=Salarias fasciatus TaxID=181472 RepID=A0A672I272_SALFA
MAAVLLQALERPELNKLPKGVQNKLEKFVTELQNANEALRTQHERFKADSEQQYFDIEKRLLGSQEQILSATKDLQTVKEENKKLNEELSTLKGIEGETGEVKPTQQAKYEIEAEKRELARLLEKRTQEVENLTEDVKRLNEKLTDANKVKMELQLKLDGIESSAASVQHREKRMEQEKELLEKKAEWLSAELKTKTEELLKTSREKGKEILELQGNLKISKEQVNRLESQLTSLKQINENQNKRAEDLNNKLKQLSAMDEKYRNELNAHVKLSSLYKVSQDKALSDLSLAYLIKLFSSICRTMSFSYCRGRQQRWRLRIKSSAERLKRGPSLTEEQLDSMCPSAAAIAAIVKPGMKFFDLYNAYAECQTQLQLEKQETRRVSKVLDEIVQEVESKAPVLKRQREEYEGMQRSTASLFNKLEQARTEIYSLQKEKEEAKQQNEALQREKQRIETQLEDTSAQVCSLLVDLEEARGNRVSKNDGSSTDISSTSEVLSARQISFRSVEELQRQNQSLLGRLRELEEEKDRQKGQVTSARISELESSMAKLKTEMELLREQRNQQKQLSDSNARQRDMYKALLTQSTGFSLPPQGQDSSASAAPVRPSVPATRSTPQRAAAAESAQTAQAKAALKQLNDAFTLYKKEKAENDRMLNETNDRLQRQLTEFRSSHAKLTSQLEFSNKRYEMLQETVNAYRREISALQERNQKMAATAQRHEHIIHTMSQDLRQTNEKLALEEVRVENLSKERDLLRQAESRLNREKEAMLAEQRNQNLLLTNLKSIQLTMERTDTETRQRLNNKIEKLEAELSSMKTRMDQEIAQRHALGRTMDAQLLEAKKQLETQNTLQQKTRELLRTSEQQVASLKAQLAAASSSEAAAASTSATPATRAAALRAPLRAEEQNNELTEQLKNTNATVQQYRSVVLTLEDSLKKEKESRSPLELRVKESEELQKQLEKRILEVEKMKQQEEEERRKAMDAVEKQVSELQRSLKSSQTEQQEALERAAAAVTLEQKAIQESLLQTKLAGEAQSKYERELMLHAADVEALQELKKKFQQDTTRKRELEEQLKKTSALLQEKTAAWNAAEKKMKEDQANQNRRCEELGKQNALLHQQMDELATKSRQLQQQQHQQQLDLSFSEEGKTTEQILEILRFVRREKEIAETRCEASDKEALRYKQRVEHQDREIKELHEALNVERERMQATVKTLAQQEEQLKKMETISALQENNRMLKMDRDKLEQELNQAQVKLSKLQADISPLHHSLSQLSEKNGSLQADRRLLEEDLKRWKARAQQLMSQQKDGDTEERQKLIAEKEAHLRRITNLAEETGKLKTELARANATSNLAQTQVQGLKDAIARLTSERDSLKKEVENSNNVILEKNKTITQVKKIGRRYKTQFDELKAQHDKVQNQLKAAQSQAQARQNQIQQIQRELQQAKESLQQNVSTQKEQQQSLQTSQQKHNQEVNSLKTSLSQAESKLSETKSREEQLKQQMSDKEEKTKKVFMGAKTKINQLNTAKEKLSQEIEELKQSKEELEVRMNALKSQYEGRLLRQDRELRELRETQTHSEPREEPQDQSGAKVRATRPADPRQMSLKSPAQDRGSGSAVIMLLCWFSISSSLSEPPTANIRPTPSTPSPSNKPSPSPGSKATPRASIRPMVTPAPVPVPTPTATVMPTTQTDSQEGKSENSQPLMSAGGSVHSTSSGIVNAPASLNQPTSSQATAFVQPTQQQIASQDAASSVDSERPSTSSSLPATGEMCLQLLKKFRKCIKCLISQINELPEEGFPMLAEDEEEEGVSQSVPSDQMSSQESALIRDVIVIDTDSESQESKEEPIQEAEGEEEEEEEEEEGEEEEEEEEEAQDDEEEEEEPTEGGNNAEDGSGVASSDQQRPSESAHGGEPPLKPLLGSPGFSLPRWLTCLCSPAGDGSSEATPDSDAPRDSVHFPPTSTSSLAPSPSSSSLTPRLPHTRRPPHALPPRLYIQPPAPELGPPPTQRQSSQLRRPSAGRGPQLTPGIGTMQPFFDDDDRMVPSTPTLVVPHRTDGFAEAIHSPQVAGLSTRFRFGPPEDLLPQTSASHSDLGQLASQGGLGMYESPLFLPAHDEDGGGRSVPTTPLQVAAPVTVFTESLPSDSTDNMASQSVPMVTASSGMAAAADDGDEVFMEHEGDGPSIESSLDSQTDMESTGQQSDDASLPSTSQVPGNLIYPDFISCLKCRNLYF